MIRPQARLFFFLLALCLAGAQAAAAWPEKPIRIVVGYNPGSLGDVTARMLSDSLRAQFGQSAVVENRPGAAGNIAAASVVSAPADGYIFLIGPTNSFVIAQHLQKLTFDPLVDLEPISILTDVPAVLFLNSSVPARTFKELVQFARSNPGKLNYASPGSGTTLHIATEALNRAYALGMTHIPYAAGARTIGAVVANDVQLTMLGAGPAIPHVKSGTLLGLAVWSKTRLPSLPDVPTFEEAGLADFKPNNWWAMASPKGTAGDVVEKMFHATQRWLARPEVQARLATVGLVPVGTSPAQTKKQFAADSEYWRNQLRELGIKAE